MRYLLALAAVTLAACGAEAPPSFADRTTPGVSLTGEAMVGIRTTL